MLKSRYERVCDWLALPCARSSRIHSCLFQDLDRIEPLQFSLCISVIQTVNDNSLTP
ncbi:Uncharacterised protein [Vibrio cholerae]|nr:Uncharacterised protein [Vibrio cholerae]CSB84241.1 Uncharacterised protein [Vibrio cholerae]CSD11085.1 Uncharacterised protein [Vibrio cholerae]